MVTLDTCAPLVDILASVLNKAAVRLVADKEDVQRLCLGSVALWHSVGSKRLVRLKGQTGQFVHPVHSVGLELERGEEPLLGNVAINPFLNIGRHRVFVGL